MTFVLSLHSFADNGSKHIHTLCAIERSKGVAIDSTGCFVCCKSLWSTDFERQPAGNISPLRGTGSWGFSGDGGAATGAKLYNPSGVAVDASGNVYIADDSNNRVRKITIVVLFLPLRNRRCRF